MLRAAALLVATIIAALAAGCGGGPGGETGPAGAAGGPFPVTIAHRYGQTVIAAEPRRVVSLGLQEHDSILALGVTPVAVRYWYGDRDEVIRPWARAAAGDADPEVLEMPFDDLDVERIAALRPDLILGVYSGMTEEDHRRLSRIAPAVAQPGEYDFGVPWQVMTRTAGRALGREERAERLVAELEAGFADLRERHPHRADRTLVVATHRGDGYSAFASEDPRSRFFRDLGFRIPGEVDRLAGDSFFVELSRERARLLDRDVLVWDQIALTPGGRATIEGDPLVRGLGVTREGRSVFLEGELEDAFGWNTVLSIPAVLDGVVPLLERAAPAP